MVVISTEWNGGCTLGWYIYIYWLLQLKCNEEISPESELLAFGCWLLAKKRLVVDVSYGQQTTSALDALLNKSHSCYSASRKLSGF